MTIITGILMAITIAGALLAVSLRNIMHAIFGLAIALLGTAALFVLLSGPFVAVMQVLIYVGGISVAMIFAVMLSTVVARQTPESSTRRLFAAAAVVLFFGGVGVVLSNAGLTARGALPAGAWRLERIGASLLKHYNVVFETLSVVLLLAIIGAIVIARQEPEDDAQGDEP